jgi:hypothetical protein
MGEVELLIMGRALGLVDEAQISSLSYLSCPHSALPDYPADALETAGTRRNWTD